MKKNSKIAVFGLLAVAAILISGCTKNYYYDCPGVGGDQSLITLSSEVQFGATPRLQDEQIVSGQSLSLFVTRAGSLADEDRLYLNNRITANGMGGFSYRIPMYYPSDGASVDFYAIHPYAADATFENPVTFSVQTDQTLEVNYLNSDLLFGARLNVTPQVNAIPLTFYHKLSKLNFIVTTADASIDLNGLTEITVLGTLPQTTINVQNGNITPATGTANSIQAYGDAQLTGGLGNQTVTGYTAIVVPQTAAAAQQLFGLMIDGKMRYYTPVSNIAFAPGTQYTVTLDITDAGISLESQIENWTNGGSISGPAGPK